MKPAKALKTLDVVTRREWRTWLQKNHRSESEIWMVFHKRHTGRASVGYDDAVEEALCFGWIDSIIRRLDAARYARKFTPRKPDSKWSPANRRRYGELRARGLLAPAGVERPPTAGSSYGPRPTVPSLPRYIERALRSRPSAWRHFEQLAPSHRRRYVLWIDTAKRSETKGKRLRDTISLLVAGKELGLK